MHHRAILHQQIRELPRQLRVIDADCDSPVLQFHCSTPSSSNGYISKSDAKGT
jgi:hypothetical protein